MDIEKTIKDLVEQNRKISENLLIATEQMKIFSDALSRVYEIAFINEYLIGHILNEKFNIPRPEINQLITKAKEENKKAIEEIKKIRRMFNLKEESNENHK